MINLSKSGDTIVFEFINNGHYLQNGTIEVPVNSLSLVMDSSNMCTFYKADSNDVFVSATYDELGKTKAEMEAWYEENMVAPQGGGGGVTTGQVQTMIDNSVSGYADSVLYNSTSKYVEFYHNGTGGTKVYEFDASDFVIDGMVDDVRIETISGVSYLVIDFNTASGKEDIQIPLTDIFNPSDYYTKTEVDQALSGKQDTLSAGTNITITDNVISADVDVKGVEGGRGISVTTGETADTVAFNLPIYQGKGNSSLSLTQPSGTTQYDNKVSGYSTTAIGAGLNVNNQFETALGVHNVDSVNTSGTFGQSGVTLFSIGNGAGQNARHNAIEIKQNGDLYIADTNNTTYTDFYTKPMVKLQDVLDGKQDTLSAGTNITISGNVISAEGGGKAVSGGTNISITTGETADTINCTLPITISTSNPTSVIIGNDNNKPFIGANYSFAEGVKGGIGDISHNSHKEGYYSTIGNYAMASHVEGYYCSVGFNSKYSHSEGYYTKTTNESEHSSGRYNVSNKANTTFGDSGNTLFSVGNGTAENARHNAFEIRQNGDIYITSGGTDIKLQDNLGSTIEISSAITSGDTNPVQGGAIYDELRVGTPTQEVVLEWEQSDGGESTNYPSGCTKLTVEVDENEMTSGGYTLQNDNYDCFGIFQIESNNGVITVTTNDCNSNPSTSITYSISGNVVTIEYPTITGVTNIGTSYDNYWTFKAIIEGEVKSLKEYTYDKFDEVEEVTAASLNALNDNFGGMKLVKLTQSAYDNLLVKDSMTLYIIVN